MTDQSEILDMTADIVSAFVSNNTVRSGDLPDLIATVHASLVGIIAPKAVEEPVVELKPAVSIKKSITDEYLICLDDGKKFKSLKRHLAQLGMTPEDYRAKWGLPRDYPMVAPSYAAKRSELAKVSGLGSDRRKAPAIVEPVAPPPEPVPAVEPMKAAAKRAKRADRVASEPVQVAAPVKRRGRAKKAD